MNDVLDRLPKSWRREKLKHVADFRVSNVDKLTNEDEQPVRLCNYTDVYYRDFITPDLPLMEATATNAEIKRFHLEVGDVVITKDSESWDDIAVPALIEETAPDLVCGYHLAMIRGHENEIDGRFLFRCFQSGAIRSQLEIEAKGVTRYGLPNSAIGETILPLPPLPTQRRIAAYLDRETAQIDALMTEKETLLGLLEEKRASLISHAVTRGLNPKAKLKPSGIPWLGEVPVYWQVRRLRFLLKGSMKYGANESALSEDTEHPRFIRITDLNPDGSLRPETYKSLSPELAAPYLLKNGDILFARTGATVGKALIYRESMGSACYAGYLIRARLKLDLLLPEFLFQFTQSAIYWEQIRLGTIQATIQNFSAEKYAEMLVPLPPTIREQQEIIDYVMASTLSIQTVLSEIRTSIQLLREKRSSLISAAVTGEMDLTN